MNLSEQSPMPVADGNCLEQRPLHCRANKSSKNPAAMLTVALTLALMPTAQAATDDMSGTGAEGPIRLQPQSQSVDRQIDTSTTSRSSAETDQRSRQAETQTQSKPANDGTELDTPEKRQPYIPSDFERYVRRAEGGGNREVIRRFGSELMSGARESVGQIPQDYVINVGDEVLVTLWGSVDADLRLTVDRTGRISLPRVGPVMVAGLRYGDLSAAIDQRVGQVFRNYKLSASLGRLRSIRIYVTGFTQRPGAYSVSSLSTLVNALMQSGGPSAAGSYRNIELRRAGKLLSSFDFYDLLIKGDKSGDHTLQAEDVVHIGAVGPQVALLGSVNKPAIFELKAGESIDDVLAMAGGFTAIADRSRLAVEPLQARNDTRIKQLSLPEQGRYTPNNGDVLRAFSAVDAALSQVKQNKRVRVEGEVRRPGEFILPANSTVADAIQAAGGLTSEAYLFGTEFSRESVRQTQQENYERALRDLETEFTRSTSTRKALTADEASAQATQAQGSTRLIERLRAVRPTGRIVLQLNPDASALPELALEDGDRLYIPARPTTVGVFGSVFNGGSYLYSSGKSVTEFLHLAGGPTRGADVGSMFLLRANGSVVSARQRHSGWILGGAGLEGTPAQPGDTIFVPEELNKATFIQEAKEWTQILYQFGLGAAALQAIRKN